MSPSPIKTFRAVLEPDATRRHWVVARVPFDVEKAWPVRRGMRVRGEINGSGFRTSLFPDTSAGASSKERVLLVNRRMQEAAKATVGSQVVIRLEPDLEERPAKVPVELATALKGDRRLRHWFDGLSAYMRRTIGGMVSEPKDAEVRERRAERTAEWLLLVLDGESETPPILKAAFQREPLARDGWVAMTQAQRRSHLMGIFHLQTPEARERRVAIAVDDALRAAKKAEEGRPNSGRFA